MKKSEAFDLGAVAGGEAWLAFVGERERGGGAATGAMPEDTYEWVHVKARERSVAYRLYGTELALRTNKALLEAFDAAFVEAFTQRWSKVYHQLPEVKAATLARAVARRLEAMLERAASTLETFRKRFDENPLYAFDWGGDAAAAAARQHVAMGLKGIMEHQEAGGADAALKAAEREVLNLAAAPKHSSSPLSNLVEQERLAAYADFVRDMRVYR